MKYFLLIFVILLGFATFSCGVVDNATISGNASVNKTPKNCNSNAFTFVYSNGSLNGTFCDNGKTTTLQAQNVDVSGAINSEAITTYLQSQGFVTQDEMATQNQSVVFNGCYQFPKSWNITCENGSFISSNSYLVNATLDNATVVSDSYISQATGGIPISVCTNGTIIPYAYAGMSVCGGIAVMASKLTNCSMIGSFAASDPSQCTYTLAQ